MSSESQLRNEKLKQFVEKALDAGVFYERDLQERIILQILPFDEAVENLIGTFTNPSFQEVRELEARVAVLPRGSWAVIRKEDILPNGIPGHPGEIALWPCGPRPHRKQRRGSLR
jgi:hypothetical protein